MSETPQPAQSEIAKAIIFHVSESPEITTKLTMEEVLDRSETTRQIMSNVLGYLNPFFEGVVHDQVRYHVPDLRWGMICFDRQNRGISSIFVDKDGEYGYVNKQLVRFRITDDGPSVAQRFQDIVDEIEAELKRKASDPSAS